MTQLALNEVVAQALHFGFDTSGWHPALEEATQGLSAEQAEWRPAPGRNSVRDIVRHLAHWKRAALDDFAALGSREAFAAYSAQDWQPSAGSSWERELSELRELSQALIARVLEQPPEHFVSAPGGGRTPRLQTLLNLASHDAYHAGQIVLLRRLQGS